MIKLRRTAVLFLVIAMCISLSACGPKEELQEEFVSTGGQDLVIRPGADSVFSLNINSKYSLNPLVATDNFNQLVCEVVYENMVNLGEDFETIPNIVNRWEYNEDGTMWTFYLDMDSPHFFSDGTMVTSKDLRYSMERCIFSDRFNGRFSSFWGCSAEEDSLVVSLGIGNTQLDKLMNMPVIKYGTVEDPIGSGPYKFSETEPNVLVPNEYYKCDSFPVEKIHLVEYASMVDIIDAFEDSYIDVVFNDPTGYTSLGYATTNEVRTLPTTNLHFIQFNEKSTLGSMSAFRYAMNYAFDRDYLVNDMLGGNGIATPIPMYPTCKSYPQLLASSIDYDIGKTQSILSNGGIRDYDEDGIAEYFNGGAVKFTAVMLVCSDSSAKVGMAKKFQSDMESIGVKIEVQECTWENYQLYLERGEIGEYDEKHKWKKTGDWDMFYGEVKLRADFDLSELLDYRDNWDSKNQVFNGMNYCRTTDTTFKQYLENYLASSDYSRPDNYYLFAYYLANSGSLISLGFEKHQIISHRTIIKGIKSVVENPMYDFINWEINIH